MININDLADLDPLDRVRAADTAMDHLRDELARLGEIRRQAVLEAYRTGMSAAEIAAALGLARQSIHRIIRVADPK